MGNKLLKTPNWKLHMGTSNHNHSARLNIYDEIVCEVVILLYIHVFKREMRRKKERSKQGQTNKQGKQHSTPKAVTFPRKN